MAITTYSVVAIFVSILGFALIVSISWLLYSWSKSSNSRPHSHAWPLSSSAPEHNPHDFAPNASQHFPPTQRLMIQRGRVVPHRHSVAPSSRSGLSSIRYSGWLASGQSVNQASSSVGDAASIRSGRLSRFSSRAGRRTPPMDLESSASIYSDTHTHITEIPPVPPSPLSPPFHALRASSRRYSQLRSKRVHTPSVRSRRSSTSSTASDDADEKSMTSPGKNAHWSTIIEESSPSASGHNSGYNSRPISTALSPLVSTNQSPSKQSAHQTENPQVDKRNSGIQPSGTAGEQQRRTRLLSASFFENNAQGTASRESLTVHPPTTGDSSQHVITSVPARTPSPLAPQAWAPRSSAPLQSKFHVPTKTSQPVRASGYGGFDFGLDAGSAAGKTVATAALDGGMHKDTAPSVRSNTMGSEDSEMLSALPKSPGFGNYGSATR